MSTASLYDSHISSRGHGAGFASIVALLLAIGVLYAGIQLYIDLSSAPVMSALPYILLGFALLIALGFEMCNGFHDTMAANGSGLQWGTVKSLALAWVLTLPAAITLSTCLFALFIHLF